MPEYLAPGVFVEEVSTGTRPIAAVGTSTAAFFGCAPQADAHKREPFFVTSWNSFQQEFLPPPPAPPAAGEAPMRAKMDKNGNPITTPAPQNTLAAAVAGFFANGGRRLYVVNLGATADVISQADMQLLDAIDGISIVAAPGYTDEASIQQIITSCEGRQDRFAVLDTADPSGDMMALTTGMADGGLRPRDAQRGVAATYVPWIEVINPLDPKGQDRMTIAPSGHMCGVYAGTDGARGVHKAPANVPIRGVLNVSHRVTQGEQEMLNPEGVNCIRKFQNGIKVWGARTLSEQSSEYRYVPVRRLVTMISQSIEQGTQWVVFEPNDLTLWKSLRRDIGSFLHGLWRDGALAGAKPEDAFFVKCDAETTTQADIDAGRVIALIGIAPVKPAEFVIFRIGQTTAGADI